MKEAINIFDFDGTLTTETWPKFLIWVKKIGYNAEKRNDNLESVINEFRKTHNGDQLETFFSFFNNLLVDNNEKITYEELMEGEKYIRYNTGVNEFFKSTVAKNYIVSSGLKDFLKKLEIAKFFDDVYGTYLQCSEDGLITGIGEIMTDDKKILAIKDILKKNNREENDCKNVYYIGDGYSDAVAMKFVHNNGGKAIFVHQENQDDELCNYTNRIYEKLNEEGIVDFCCVADYRDGSMLSNFLKR